MAQEFDNTNRGALFKNQDKEGNQPDYRGEVNCDGVEFYLSAWVKESKNGNKFFSLSVQNKANVQKTSKSTKREQAEDSDIPF